MYQHIKDLYFKYLVSPEIIKTLAEGYKAVNNKDPKLWEHFFTEDACIVPLGRPVHCKSIKVL